MKKILLLIGIILLASCNSAKRAQRELSTGNYVKSITIAVSQLQRNKTNRRAQQQMLILEEGFQKLKQRDKKRIKFLQRENVASNSVEIHDLYVRLNEIQNQIRPLLPLQNESQSRQMQFEFLDLDQKIIEARDQMLTYLYDEANLLLNSGDKFSAREAFEDLQRIEQLRPNFKDTRQMLNEAKLMGTDFVLATLINTTDFVIPNRVQNMLLDFNTYGLADQWTDYHTERQQNLDYDYGIRIQFTDFVFSPDRLREREINLEEEVVDGWEYKKDSRGAYVRDEDGNRIKVNNYVTVSGLLLESLQQKSVAVQAQVIYRDIKAGQNINSFPLATEFIFENLSAVFQGDARVLSDEDKEILNNRPVAFPSNEQMLIDAGEDIKQKLKQILVRNKFS
ncbi:hypothetical protein [Psychroflexus maritimus]|uniref:LPP20 lipoprotein n=1 Tax=Psychroflexus maritimus TaxID=2714865 RepID=A0A967AGL0_9FLAO|nr:hypothetical protein [Psychroflexus maritimus]NGZ90868.1 hypothetical protein [Psychroflexus maritimus]